MAKAIELLLTETIEGLGIVGDVVKVRPGYARNYLLPRAMAMPPSSEAIASLAKKRLEAESELRKRRTDRELMAKKLKDHELSMQRSCNEHGQLYGSVTQKDIAEALQAEGFEVFARDVRLPHAIKRVDSYEVLLRLDVGLDTTLKLWVVPDREFESDDRVDMDFDNEGNLVESASSNKTNDKAVEDKTAEKAAETTDA